MESGNTGPPSADNTGQQNSIQNPADVTGECLHCKNGGLLDPDH